MNKRIRKAYGHSCPQFKPSGVSGVPGEAQRGQIPQVARLPLPPSVAPPPSLLQGSPSSFTAFFVKKEGSLWRVLWEAGKSRTVSLALRRLSGGQNQLLPMFGLIMSRGGRKQVQGRRLHPWRCAPRHQPPPPRNATVQTAAMNAWGGLRNATHSA